MQISVMSRKNELPIEVLRNSYLTKGYYEAKEVLPLARGQIHFWYARSWCREGKNEIGKIKKMGSVYDDELENRETRGPSGSSKIFHFVLAIRVVLCFYGSILPLDYRRN